MQFYISVLYFYPAEVKQLRELSSGNNTSDEKEVIRLQKYTLHLERQIKDSLNSESLTQLTTLNSEVERLHHSRQHLQTELDMVCNCTCVYNIICTLHTCVHVHTYIHLSLFFTQLGGRGHIWIDRRHLQTDTTKNRSADGCVDLAF